MVARGSVVGCKVEYLDKQSSVMSGPRKIRSRGSWSHIVSKATACIAGKMTGYCVFIALIILFDNTMYYTNAQKCVILLQLCDTSN